MTSFDYLNQRLSTLGGRQRLRTLVPRVCDGVYLVDAAGRRLLNFGGNDYLGFVAERRTSQGPCGSGASPLVCGWTDEHQRLADKIAKFESSESAVLFPSGYAACSGTVATLAEAGDLILSDELNHASLIDGCRLSRAQRIVYPHRDCQFVQRTLTQNRSDFQRVWIVTDGIFSMDGHVAPVAELCEIAEQHDASLIVDEAHGTGVLGETGSGVCEALGVKDQVSIRIGTLSKAIGSQGGFVAAPQLVIDYLVNRCRSLIYSTALAPAAVSAAMDSFDAIRDQPKRRIRVQKFARQLRESLSIEVNQIEAAVPIIPVVIGGDEQTVAASQRLREAGFYIPAIRPPTVPEGTARLRISLSAAHDDAMVAGLADAIGAALSLHKNR
jgi:8-amino-7-oxononanoate synthase